MPAYSIRRAGEGDAATLASIGARTFAATFGHLYAASDLKSFLEDKHSEELNARLLDDPSCALWLVEDGAGDAVGYSLACPCDLPVPARPVGAGELGRLYLLSGAQGAGIGSRLLGVTLDWLRARHQKIYLSVYAENHGAQRLYARHGFVKVHEYHYMVGNHADPEWIMELRG